MTNAQFTINNVSSSSLTYQGQTILAGTSFTPSSTQQPVFASDPGLSVDVLAGNATITIGSQTWGDGIAASMLEIIAQPVDFNGNLFVTNVPLDGQKSTYNATSTFVAASTATDIFTISGSSSKTIRILRVGISATQTTSSIINVNLLKRSTANSGGTSTTLTAVPNDSNNISATATVRSYTANPASLGSSVGNIRNIKLTIPVPAIGGNDSSQGELVENFGNHPGQALVLRGTGETFSINLNSTTVTGNSFSIWLEWTEE